MHIFKKVEIWVLYLLLVIFFIAMIGFGALVRHEIIRPESRFPLLSRAALFIAEIPINLKNLLSPTSNNLAVLEPGRFSNISGFQGEPLKEETYLLLSRYDGNVEQSVVELVNLRSFAIKKRWNPDLDQMNALVDTSRPEFEFLERDSNDKRGRILHPFLTEDGGLIFSYTGPVRKIDQNSQLVWQNQEDFSHHSIEQDHEGNFWVNTHMLPDGMDEKYVSPGPHSFRDDAIAKVSPDGKILFHKSVGKLLVENNMGYLLFRLGGLYGDPLHINDIEPVLTDSQYWKRGDVFLSLWFESMVILYRPQTNKIIWKGMWNTAGIHDVDILDDHRISVFHNNIIAGQFVNTVGSVNGANEVVIYDFETDAYSKYFDELLKDNEVRTPQEGRSQVLDNGDLFIEETDAGRILYFNNDKSLQWQYVNRADNGKIYLGNWSRILYKPADIKKVQHILSTSKN